MSEKIQCKKHKYIGKKIELIKNDTGLPLECSICKKIYFSDGPLHIKTASKQTMNFCSHCRQELKCMSCKCNFDLDSFFIAECIKCGNVELFCKKCSKKIFIPPLKSDSEKKAILKLEKILKEFAPGLEGGLLKDLGKLKNQKGHGNIPPVLFFHFDICLPDMLGGFDNIDGHDIEDADWWKK